MHNSAEIQLSINGVTLKLASNHFPLVEYAEEHLGGLTSPAGAPCDINVNCLWEEAPWDAEANPFPVNGEMNKIGKRMLGKTDELIWLNTVKMKGLKLRFRKEKSHFAFDVVYSYQPRVKKGVEIPEYIYKRYFSLMSYVVYYPIFWYLENFKNWTPIHASALEVDGAGVVVGGLGGIGKTTTCVALIQQANARLISENMVFTDGAKLYPCYEPIRLNEESIAILESKVEGLREMHFPEGLKDKSLYHIDTKSLPTNVPPKAIFLPVFSPVRYTRQIDPQIAAEKFCSTNRLTRELDDFYWYAGALEMTWPRIGQAALRANVLHQLTQSAKCYELGIDRNLGVDAVVEDIISRTL